ncbi:solute carrier organic anion transporter family member 1B2 [Pieris rapae]|uniref:solute carrier organic anion transporter family member 1B2 n=1 Tax=Pieris rapae TaxID=64459 RepID=UPI001E27AEE0|nr:solute carrier organic anion transporter family member 1B2 [Pieris rapae]XP_022123017.2 solute carrier organic anion transporter family member 1B2 [Pieris rapae]
MGCFNTVWNKAKSKVQSWHKTEFVPSKVRDPIFGNIITMSIAETAAYRIICQDLRVGLLPSYAPYLLISFVAMFEALLGPFVAWCGYKTRKRMMLGWSIGFILASFCWFAIPSPVKLTESDFCENPSVNTNILFAGLSARTAVRMFVTVFVAICFCLARVATWSHYIAYADDQDPKRTTVDFGLLVIARVIPLIFGYKMLSMIVEVSVLLKILIITLTTLLNIAKIYFVVPTSEHQIETKAPPMEDRGFFRSLFRVLCNVLAMSQMLSVALIAAAFWGFGYNEEEIVKTNFDIDTSDATIIDHHVEFFRYLCAILGVVYIGVKYSTPIRTDYEIPRALKHISKMTLIAAIMYILIVVVPPCTKGHVAGLENSNVYTHPQCSLSCGCVPKWNEYNPVCVVDTMSTYLSPCEAGCTGSYTIENLLVYSNCSCAGLSGQAAPGACSNFNCQTGYNFHMTAYAAIMILSVLAFQSQGMVILKSVDPRDKSIAMGMMWSVIAAVSYVCASNIFFSIAWKTCSWYTGDKCQLYEQRFSYIIGFTCAGLVFIALVINFVAIGYLRLKNKRTEDRNEDNGERTDIE